MSREKMNLYFSKIFKSFLCLVFFNIALSDAQNNQIQQNGQLPASKICLFTCSEWIFKEKVAQFAPSANLLGPGQLSKHQIGLPCDASQNPQGGSNLKYQNVWGAVYVVDESEYEAILKQAQYQYQTPFASYENVIVVNYNEMSCLTVDLGIQPGDHPPRQSTPPRIPTADQDEAYYNQLANLGVPQDYVTGLRNASPKHQHQPVLPRDYQKPPRNTNGYQYPPIQNQNGPRNFPVSTDQQPVQNNGPLPVQSFQGPDGQIPYTPRDSDTNTALGNPPVLYNQQPTQPNAFTKTNGYQYPPIQNQNGPRNLPVSTNQQPVQTNGPLPVQSFQAPDGQIPYTPRDFDTNTALGKPPVLYNQQAIQPNGFRPDQSSQTPYSNNQYPYGQNGCDTNSPIQGDDQPYVVITPVKLPGNDNTGVIPNHGTGFGYPSSFPHGVQQIPSQGTTPPNSTESQEPSNAPNQTIGEVLPPCTETVGNVPPPHTETVKDVLPAPTETGCNVLPSSTESEEAGKLQRPILNQESGPINPSFSSQPAGFNGYAPTNNNNQQPIPQDDQDYVVITPIKLPQQSPGVLPNPQSNGQFPSQNYHNNQPLLTDYPTIGQPGYQTYSQPNQPFPNQSSGNGAHFVAPQGQSLVHPHLFTPHNQAQQPTGYGYHPNGDHRTTVLVNPEETLPSPQFNPQRQYPGHLQPTNPLNPNCDDGKSNESVSSENNQNLRPSPIPLQRPILSNNGEQNPQLQNTIPSRPQSGGFVPPYAHVTNPTGRDVSDGSNSGELHPNVAPQSTFQPIDLSPVQPNVNPNYSQSPVQLRPDQSQPMFYPDNYPPNQFTVPLEQPDESQQMFYLDEQAPILTNSPQQIPQNNNLPPQIYQPGSNVVKSPPLLYDQPMFTPENTQWSPPPSSQDVPPYLPDEQMFYPDNNQIPSNSQNGNLPAYPVPIEQDYSPDQVVQQNNLPLSKPTDQVHPAGLRPADHILQNGNLPVTADSSPVISDYQPHATGYLPRPVGGQVTPQQITVPLSANNTPVNQPHSTGLKPIITNEDTSSAEPPAQVVPQTTIPGVEPVNCNENTSSAEPQLQTIPQVPTVELNPVNIAEPSPQVLTQTTTPGVAPVNVNEDISSGEPQATVAQAVNTGPKPVNTNVDNLDTSSAEPQQVVPQVFNNGLKPVNTQFQGVPQQTVNQGYPRESNYTPQTFIAPDYTPNSPVLGFTLANYYPQCIQKHTPQYIPSVNVYGPEEFIPGFTFGTHCQIF